MTAQPRPESDARVDIEKQIPNLAQVEWYIKSPFDDSYQCIAWAACYTNCHMWPHRDYTWFPDPNLPLVTMPEEAPVEYFIDGFKLLGYEPCESTEFELGYQKVAIYANDAGVTHMARQHFWGRGWLSKLGVLEDILHRNLEDIEGDMSPMANGYGRVVQVLKRNWWVALIKLCLFRSTWATLRFWLYRVARGR